LSPTVIPPINPVFASCSPCSPPFGILVAVTSIDVSLSSGFPVRSVLALFPPFSPSSDILPPSGYSPFLFFSFCFFFCLFLVLSPASSCIIPAWAAPFGSGAPFLSCSRLSFSSCFPSQPFAQSPPMHQYPPFLFAFTPQKADKALLCSFLPRIPPQLSLRVAQFSCRPSFFCVFLFAVFLIDFWVGPHGQILSYCSFAKRCESSGFLLCAWHKPFHTLRSSG